MVSYFTKLRVQEKVELHTTDENEFRETMLESTELPQKSERLSCM